MPDRNCAVWSFGWQFFRNGSNNSTWVNRRLWPLDSTIMIEAELA
jgi:hypothetical protein